MRCQRASALAGWVRESGNGASTRECRSECAAGHLLMSRAVRATPPTPMLSVSLFSGALPACSHTQQTATPATQMTNMSRDAGQHVAKGIEARGLMQCKVRDTGTPRGPVPPLTHKATPATGAADGTNRPHGRSSRKDGRGGAKAAPWMCAARAAAHSPNRAAATDTIVLQPRTILDGLKFVDFTRSVDAG
jgi:hypothetical protein